MLVPLTNAENPYSKMMLQLIADQTPFPQTPWPRRRGLERVDAPLSRGQRLGVLGSAAALAVVVVMIALSASRALQS